MHVHGPPSLRRTLTFVLAAPLALAGVLGPSLLASARAQSPLEPREWPEAPALSTIQGEPIPPEMIGETVVESWEDVFARAAREPRSRFERRARNGAQGEWVIAPLRRDGIPHSGRHFATNKWGDPRMGIGFAEKVDVRGTWIAGEGSPELWPAALIVIGYRDGVEVGRTETFTALSHQPAWMEMRLDRVDRIELVVDPKGGHTGRYGIDDLTFVRDGREVVVDFEDASTQTTLTGTRYAGLDWEVGTGDMPIDAIHAPLTREAPTLPDDDGVPTLGGGGTAPNLVSSFVGPRLGDAGAGYIPPDTCGAVGPSHFVTAVNSNLSVYVKSTGTRVMNTDLGVFLAGDSFGDPRVTFDKVSQRFIVLATDFSNEISIAISNTSDPTGTWTKATFNPAGGTDAGKWPDYPTLGVNKDFIATSSYMVGGSDLMTIFAIDKQNFISTGSLTITAFRGLPWEGAIHPATTWDATASQYLVSRTGSGLRIRRLNLPASAPTLSELGIASASTGSSPPDAPAQGSGVPLDTLDGRFMNAWWINGSLWTTNCIASGGRAGCRWYQVNTSSIALTQSGTVDDPVLYYFMPSIAVNASNDVVLAFTGSSASQFAATYFTGRLSTDPAGQMGVPVLYKAGEGSYQNLDGFGRNRWGDYSLSSIDPADDATLWTIQEYARTGNAWGTYIAELEYPGFTDCNQNGVDDSIDISNGTSQDCDGNGVPDECQPDCDGDTLPDVCEVDCNANGTPDDCEVFGDCNSNGVPDECDPDCDGDGVPDDCEDDCNGNGEPDDCEGLDDCDGNGIPDVCETFADCNSNGVPDPCEPDCDGDQIPDDCESDCDGNGVPDDCDLVFPDCDGDGVHDGCEADCDGDATPDDCEPDCDGDGTPDDCEGSPDCNQNGVPDECDISSGTSADVNGNGVPDECELVAVDYCFCTTGICGNHDAAAGCANSTGAGALLAASGSGSVSADDLVLTMAPLPTNKFGLFYMGTTTPSTPFGDGYRCVGGSIFRYPVLNSGGTGSISFGPIVGWANGHFSGSGHIVPGATWNFQGWYRDPAGPCGTGFNLTNGTSITFGN